MKTRVFVLAVVAVLVVCVMPSLVFTQAPGPAIDAEKSNPGKYVAMTTVQPGGSYYITVCDTQTGNCWARYSTNEKWLDLGSPIPKKEKK